VSEIGRVPKVTIKQLEDWFNLVNKGGNEPHELQEWSAWLSRLIQKWIGGERLSQEEVDFVATSLTAISDDLLDWLREGDLNSLIQKCQQILEDKLDQDGAEVVKAWERLKDALARQFLEADQARLQGRPSNTTTLNRFYAALNDLKQRVKEHSGTPKNRQPINAERDETIYSMYRAGKNPAQIANDLPKIYWKWKVNTKTAAQAVARYRERVQMLRTAQFRDVFTHPPDRSQ